MFTAARERTRSGFKLVLAAGTRRDMYLGENAEGLTREITFSPERLAEAERRKNEARQAELDWAQAAKTCK